MGNVVKKVWSFLISMQTTFALLLIFAFSIAAGTFIENDFGTETAWAVIYATKWFELLQIILAVNLVGNIVRFKLYKMKKFPTFIFHISFLVILIGSGITRYSGYEGVLHIREGQSEFRMISSDSFLQIRAKKGEETAETQQVLYLSSIPGFGNNFSDSLEIGGQTLNVRYKKFIKEAVQVAAEDPDGSPVISFVVPMPQGPEKYFMDSGESEDFGPVVVNFDTDPDLSTEFFHLYTRGDAIYFTSNKPVKWVRMADRQEGMIEPGTEWQFETRHLYMVNGMQIVPKEVFVKGSKKVIPASEYDIAVQMKNKNNLSALVVDVEYGGAHKEVALMGKGKRYRGFTEYATIGDVELTMEWGSKMLQLPFALHLRDFVLEKYPGSMSPSSYESHVTLLDEKNGVREHHRIYMNNTLDYGGYLFFQSSYDQDEMGTILSVNHDPGKWPTYLGYTLLIVGMMMNFFNPNGRFGKLARTRYDKTPKSIVAVLATVALLGIAQPAKAADAADHTGHNHAQHEHTEPTEEQLAAKVKKIDRKHAENFGKILVQGRDGRIKPMDTVTTDLVNKMHGGASLFGLTSSQVILGMSSLPNYWQRIKMFKTTHPELRKVLGMKEGQKYFAYIDIFNQRGQYKLNDAVNEAHRKRPGERGTFDKEIIKVDERVSIAYMVYAGDHMRIFPLKDDVNNKWYTPGEVMQKFPMNEKQKIQALLQGSYNGLLKGMNESNWDLADKIVEEIKQYQHQVGAQVIPPQTVTDVEIIYNKLGIFERLYPVYLLSGLLLLMLIFIRLAKPSVGLTAATKIVFFVLVVSFIAHTASLGMRWYVAGHAPWSNGYEAMLYIAWTVVLSGIVFSKQSEFALSTTGVLAGLILFVAHLSWLDPQITTMAPVLKSYWLTIHVSIITASYGFLALSALLGFISMILYIFAGKEGSQRREQVKTSIKEAARVSEMSMIIGLCLVTIGNFLGGVWANESWGRYWGWDPKETWALVTILVYAAVVHMRFVPALKSIFAFSVASILSYSSVIMTYFGVNYYLSGLHSYASGDPVPIPVWVYYAIAVIFTVIILASRNAHILKSKN